MERSQNSAGLLCKSFPVTTSEYRANIVDSHQGFDSCCILLFNAAQKLLHRNYNGLDHTVTHIEDCIDLLVWCSSSSFAAGRFVDLLRPLYKRLRALLAAVTNTGSTKIGQGFPYLQRDVKVESSNVGDLSNGRMPTSNSELLDFVEETTQLLLDPLETSASFHRP